MVLEAKILKYRTNFSDLEEIRRKNGNLIPDCLINPHQVRLEENEALGAVADHDDIKNQFPTTYGLPRVTIKSDGKEWKPQPLKIGVVLSGGQAPGGHNVIAGIYDYVKKISNDSEVIGFLSGPHGLFTGNYTIVDDGFMDAYRNSGGFDMIGSGRHKIEKAEDFASSLKYATELNLNGIVIIGGDDSNTNAAILGEYFAARGSNCKVCGAPKTIDGDLKVHPYIPTSFGFDTACRTYSEMIGNLAKDTMSSQKYYHFVRLMGRSASHIALECALQTRPNVCLIGEEVEAKNQTLEQVTEEIVQVILERRKLGKNYGVILIPEGIIEFIPEFNRLMGEINDMNDLKEDAVLKKLSKENKETFTFLPSEIREQILLDRDPHGNVMVSRIETERLIAMTVATRLDELKNQSKYDGVFVPQFHSFGYEGRSGLPSHFDATYCYVLGSNVASLISLGCNGLISSVTGLDKPVKDWNCGGVPITMMCNMEKRHGKMKPVIKKALTELDGAPFLTFQKQRNLWGRYDLYRSPGPLQFFADDCTTSCEISITLRLELDGKDERMDESLLKSAIKIQENADKNNRKRGYIYCPLVEDADKIQSPIEIARKKFVPAMCPPLLEDPVLLVKSSSQAKFVSDRKDLNHIFPNTYGAPLVSIVSSSTTTTTVPSPHRSSKLASVPNGITKSDTILTHKLNPGNVGVVFVGRQSPGGHDVVSGLYDTLSSSCQLYGFINGTKGLLEGLAVELTEDIIATYRGQGGFDMLGRSMDSISSKTKKNDDNSNNNNDDDDENFNIIIQQCKKFNLSGLVLIGGNKTATDAALLSEYISLKKEDLCIVTIPVDITGQIISELCETSVGFDTATKVSSQIVGNNSTDGRSAKKYYYFMRIMGGYSSHTSLEVVLRTKPNYVLLSEEVSLKQMSLRDIVNSISDLVVERDAIGKNFGTIVIPESLIESISELKVLIRELGTILKENKNIKLSDNEGDNESNIEQVKPFLTSWSRALYEMLPNFTQIQLLLERNSSHELNVSRVDTERLLCTLVEKEMKVRESQGSYTSKFAGLPFFIGYQSRGSSPSNFDVQMAYNLGGCAVNLINNNINGYMAVINNVKLNINEWKPAGVPLTALLQINTNTNTTTSSNFNSNLSNHKDNMTVPVAQVDLTSASYQLLEASRGEWRLNDMYENPGPIQFYGPNPISDDTTISNSIAKTLSNDGLGYSNELDEVESSLLLISNACKPGSDGVTVRVAHRTLTALADSLQLLNSKRQRR